MKISALREESCASEPCAYYQRCRQTQKYVNSVQQIKMDNFIIRSLDTVNTFVCECPQGFTSSDVFQQLCDQRIDQCFSSPCQYGGLCVPLEGTYRCECMDDRTGRNCEHSAFRETCLPHSCFSGAKCVVKERKTTCEKCRWERHDSDTQCRLRSISFNGEAYLAVPAILGRIEWKVQFSIATISSAGILMFAGALTSDFVEISLDDALLRARFSLGGKISQVIMEDWKENKVNDGNWHTVTVDYYENSLFISLDDCHSYISLKMSNITGYRKCAAMVTSLLPKKCVDEAVSCHRFLDISSDIYLGARPGAAVLLNSNVPGMDWDSATDVVEDGYDGCISNFTLNGHLQHFSRFDDFEKTSGVFPGCSQKKEECEKNPCHPSAKCEERWGGYLCKCENQLHSNSSCEQTSISSVMLYDEESYVSWKVRKALQIHNISFEFRTRSRETQVLAIEFSLRSQFIIFSISQGRGLISVGMERYLVPFPYFSDGTYKAVRITFDATFLIFFIDHLYKKEIPILSEPYYGIAKIYSGLAPSTSYPQRFEGCLRNIEVNGMKVKVLGQSKTKNSCEVPNQCSQQGICPRSSRCVRDWERHRCECIKGYVGDSCVDICTLPNICGSHGLCLRSNNSHGYTCRCSEGFSGNNCERKRSLQICPRGWYGSFPNCKKCDCERGRGFKHQCDKKTGLCVCEPGRYLSDGKCLPCECGYGATGVTCSLLGQCRCVGEAVGRRCDRCFNDHDVLDRKSLKCLPIHNRCPSNIEYGIQWPTTVNGAVARQSCPNDEIGLAVRKCGTDGIWKEVDAFNCTLPSYKKLSGKLNSTDLAQLLANATDDPSSLRGVNLRLATDTFKTIVLRETKRESDESNHLRWPKFTSNILRAADSILTAISPLDFMDFMFTFINYGEHLRDVHLSHPYIDPFFFSSNNFVFSIDELQGNSHHILPKFDNFVDDRPEEFRHLQVELLCSMLRSKRSIFFVFFKEVKCRSCEAPIVAVMFNESCSVRVAFPVNEESGWKYPECVRLNNATSRVFSTPSEDSDGQDNLTTYKEIRTQWTSQSSTLAGLNSTHAVCQFETFGVFTVLVRPDQGALIRLTPSGSVPYTGPLSAGFALLLSLLSAASTLFRDSVRTRFIRFGFIVSFVLDATSMFFIHRIQPSNVFCPVRNAVISFSTSAMFAWLFLYSLHVYRLLSEESAKSSFTVCLLCGVVMPVLLSLITFFFAPGCSLAVNGWLFWVFATPLSFYASSTSFLISMNKQFDVLVAKYSLRRTLLLHFILTALCVLYNAVALYVLYDRHEHPIYDVAANTLLVFVSTYIFLWTNYFGQKLRSRNAGGLWLNDTPKSAADVCEPQCHSPLLPQATQIDPSVAAEHEKIIQWMPDIIPSKPHSHDNASVSLPRPKILSPPTKILHAEAVYGNDGTNAQCSPNFYRATDDDVDHAYGTYTSRRFYPSSTFTR